ncbi:hypothetical protein N7532_001488 [Penicillium argentinense]|uniref:Uncharacterized protein n=1 Tax=Penicillium argentinense TaxID=1131581 RepID=A0A9W9KMH7_9EURO|nr:uncharacterized protein N7532_001488 [Penicillium argentinense]KAJ5110953.1 hypothetical protein N7532_001488 [Penicillium argentinense]
MAAASAPPEQSEHGGLAPAATRAICAGGVLTGSVSSVSSISVEAPEIYTGNTAMRNYYRIQGVDDRRRKS